MSLLIPSSKKKRSLDAPRKRTLISSLQVYCIVYILFRRRIERSVQVQRISYHLRHVKHESTVDSSLGRRGMNPHSNPIWTVRRHRPCGERVRNAGLKPSCPWSGLLVYIHCPSNTDCSVFFPRLLRSHRFRKRDLPSFFVAMLFLILKYII